MLACHNLVKSRRAKQPDPKGLVSGSFLFNQQVKGCLLLSPPVCQPVGRETPDSPSFAGRHPPPRWTSTSSFCTHVFSFIAAEGHKDNDHPSLRNRASSSLLGFFFPSFLFQPFLSLSFFRNTLPHPYAHSACVCHMQSWC